jgi:hypothetical protein
MSSNDRTIKNNLKICGGRQSWPNCNYYDKTEENEKFRKTAGPDEIREQPFRIKGKNITAYANTLHISLARRIVLHGLSLHQNPVNISEI